MIEIDGHVFIGLRSDIGELEYKWLGQTAGGVRIEANANATGSKESVLIELQRWDADLLRKLARRPGDLCTDMAICGGSRTPIVFHSAKVAKLVVNFFSALPFRPRIQFEVDGKPADFVFDCDIGDVVIPSI